MFGLKRAEHHCARGKTKASPGGKECGQVRGGHESVMSRPPRGPRSKGSWMSSSKSHVTLEGNRAGQRLEKFDSSGSVRQDSEQGSHAKISPLLGSTPEASDSGGLREFPNCLCCCLFLRLYFKHHISPFPSLHVLPRAPLHFKFMTSLHGLFLHSHKYLYTYKHTHTQTCRVYIMLLVCMFSRLAV